MNIIDLIKSQLSDTVIDKVAGSVGLSNSDVHKALGGIIPAQLDSIIKIGSTNTGAGHLLSLFERFSGLGNVAGVIGKPDGMSSLLKMGESLVPMLFGKQSQSVFDGIGQAVGIGNSSAIGNLSKFIAPVIMSVFAGQTKGLNPLQLIGSLGSLKSVVGGLLPAGLSGVLGGISGLGDGMANLNIPGLSMGVQGSSASGSGHSSSHSSGHASASTSTSRSSSSKKGFPWWIPLVGLLAGLAFALSMCNKQPSMATGSGTGTTAGTTTGSATGTEGGEGTAGGEIAVDPATAAKGVFGLGFPADGSKVPFGGFTMKGTGKPGETVAITEDGVDLGTVVVGKDGTWSFDVPSSSAGAHKYSVASGDQPAIEFGATIDQPKTGMTCSNDLTLSMADNQTVSQPFRFGGKGKGKGYTVTVKRGSRVVGTKDIKLDAGCGWSYKSNPGKGPISYEIRELGATGEALKSINLTVVAK